MSDLRPDDVFATSDRVDGQLQIFVYLLCCDRSLSTINTVVIDHFDLEWDGLEGDRLCIVTPAGRYFLTGVLITFKRFMILFPLFFKLYSNSNNR